jgi:hypothetical protein
VFILKVVKVLCFDTLLQVLILKVVRVVSSMSLPSFAGDGADGCRVVALGIPHPRYFGKRVWKLLKTKDGNRKKSAKREKESARD